MMSPANLGVIDGRGRRLHLDGADAGAAERRRARPEGRAQLPAAPRGQLLLGCSFTSRAMPSSPKRTVYLAPTRSLLVDVTRAL